MVQQIYAGADMATSGVLLASVLKPLIIRAKGQTIKGGAQSSRATNNHLCRVLSNHLYRHTSIWTVQARCRASLWRVSALPTAGIDLVATPWNADLYSITSGIVYAAATDKDGAKYVILRGDSGYWFTILAFERDLSQGRQPRSPQTRLSASRAIAVTSSPGPRWQSPPSGDLRPAHGRDCSR